MNPHPIDVVYEDNHLLAVIKPAGLVTMGLRGDKPTLLSLAKQYVKQRYDKPGEVYLGVVSRLDAPVTGIVLLARTSKAARRLSEQFRTHAVEKTYWALVEGEVSSDTQQCVNWLIHDDRHRRMRIVGPTHPGAKEARLTYRGLKLSKRFSLLEVQPITGRKHQIRLQLADRGHPILGDRKYGSQMPFPVGIALHARRLVVKHPAKDETVVLAAPTPDVWRQFELIG